MVVFYENLTEDLETTVYEKAVEYRAEIHYVELPESSVYLQALENVVGVCI